MWMKFLLIASLLLSAPLCEISRPKNVATGNYHQKSCRRFNERKKWSSPIQYYPNSISTFKLLISGDVESNPGPNVCKICDRTVRVNSKRLECDVCKSQTHLKCIKGTTFVIPNSRIPAHWTCFNCLLSTLPFFNVRDFDSVNDNTTPFPDIVQQPRTIHEEEDIYLKDDETEDAHLQYFNNKKGIRLHILIPNVLLLLSLNSNV